LIPAVIADTGGLLRALARTPEGKASFPDYREILISASAVVVPGLVLAEVDYFLRSDRRAMRKLIAEIFDPGTRLLSSGSVSSRVLIAQCHEPVWLLPPIRLIVEFTLCVAIGLGRQLPLGMAQLLDQPGSLARRDREPRVEFFAGFDGFPAVEPGIGPAIFVNALHLNVARQILTVMRTMRERVWEAASRRWTAPAVWPPSGFPSGSDRAR
jgi:hypothetical protein